MNLYGYSQDNNIEFGILTDPSIVGNITNTITGSNLDEDALVYFKQVIKDSELLFERKPNYESKFAGLRKRSIGFQNKIYKLLKDLI
jgi:hypothetical protein